MIVYMILDRETREPVRTNKRWMRMYNSYRDASVSLSSLRTTPLITDEERDRLHEKYAIVDIDTNRIPVDPLERATQVEIHAIVDEIIKDMKEHRAAI